VQAQVLEALEDSEFAEAEPFALGLLKVENFCCLRALPHFGQATRSPFERTKCSNVVSHSWQTYS
jgi:DNA-directed RNA polymerase subunit N (RpoN/RPB10)